MDVVGNVDYFLPVGAIINRAAITAPSMRNNPEAVALGTRVAGTLVCGVARGGARAYVLRARVCM